MNQKLLRYKKNGLPADVLNELKATLKLENKESDNEVHSENSACSSISDQDENGCQNNSETKETEETRKDVDADLPAITKNNLDDADKKSLIISLSTYNSKNDDTSHSSESSLSNSDLQRKCEEKIFSPQKENMYIQDSEFCSQNKHDDFVVSTAVLEKEDRSSICCELIDQRDTGDCLIGVYVHGTDCLKFDTVIRHPSVIIHVVDLNKDGAYLKKSEQHRNVTYNQENSDYILPAMLRPFNFKEKRSLVPQWNELVIFNERVSHLAKPSVIFFFELVDFVDFCVDPTTFIMNSELGWHQIAWAFLKVIGVNNVSNVGKKLRLQLYKPNLKSSSNRTVSNIPNVFNWYLQKPWITYPSTIYVTIKNIPISSVDNKPQQRSQTPLQPEIGSSDTGGQYVSLRNSVSDDTNNVCDNNIEINNMVQWDRLPGQSCQIPNFKIFSLHSDIRGCLNLKFSNSGRLLACGTLTDIFVYCVLTGQMYSRLIGHHGLIYSLWWSEDDAILLSSSADCTACLWDLKSSTTPLYVLPHPSYVYCSRFIMNDFGVVTGSFDSVLRIWIKTSTGNWELLQELNDHNGYVNTICVLSGTEFCSGDSMGIIIMWAFVDERWRRIKTVKIKEICGVVINNLYKHPGGKRLLIHTRDSLLRIMDLCTCAVIQRFQGGLNDTLQCGSVITPCGRFLFATSEDGTINVWDVNTGSQVAFYSELLLAEACGAVDYHPHDHIVTFACYSTTQNSNAFVIKYVRNAANNCGLRLLINSSSDCSDGEPTNNNRLRSIVENKLLKERFALDDQKTVSQRNFLDKLPNKDTRKKKILPPVGHFKNVVKPLIPGPSTASNNFARLPTETANSATSEDGDKMKNEAAKFNSIERILKHMDNVLASYEAK